MYGRLIDYLHLINKKNKTKQNKAKPSAFVKRLHLPSRTVSFAEEQERKHKYVLYFNPFLAIVGHFRLFLVENIFWRIISMQSELKSRSMKNKLKPLVSTKMLF